jgi:hypothetical protein
MRMAQPVLVVDIGRFQTRAALVVGDRAVLVPEPESNGPEWPGTGALDLTAGEAHVSLLAALRDASTEPGTSRRVERLTLVVPSPLPEPERRRFVYAAEAAGFAEVELLDDVHAAVMDAQSGIALPGDSLVMICDLGEDWSVALAQVRSRTGEVVTLAQDRSSAGRELDGRLLAHIGMAAYDQQEIAPYLRQLKDHVSQSPPDAAEPPYGLTQHLLFRLAEPGLRWVVASCRSLLARAAAGIRDSGLMGLGSLAPGTNVSHVAAVVVLGGNAGLPGVEWIISDGLSRPAAVALDPTLALVRGGVRWVQAGADRRLVAEHPRWRVEPMAWEVPTGQARLVRWSIRPGEAFRRGTVLAQVRTADERVFDLAAPDEGVLIDVGARAGDMVGPTLIASAKRPTSLLAGDQPGKRQVLSVTGEWLLTPDREVLVECAAGARRIRLWSTRDGMLIRQFAPDLDGAVPYDGRVFVRPGGRLSLVAWDRSGTFTVFDVGTGRRTASFGDGYAPLKVMVNEGEWRLTAAAEGAGSAGRYRRIVTSVWDLGTGQRLDRLTDDRHHLHGYLDRSAVDSFGEHAFSPDGRLKAVPVRSARGSTGIALQEAGNDHEVFRAEHPPSARARMAFSADGRLLLSNWDAGPQSLVDVWEL